MGSRGSLDRADSPNSAGRDQREWSRQNQARDASEHPQVTPPRHIETLRLMLRPWDDDDLDGLRRLTQRAEVMRHIGSRSPMNGEQIEQAHTAKLAHWREHGFGARAAVRKDSHEWIGYAVLQHPRPDVTELRPSDVEIGWLLLPCAWGRGYATEASVALRDEGLHGLELGRIVARYQPANVASGRIMEKIGMRFVRDSVNRHGHIVRIYGIDRPARDSTFASRYDVIGAEYAATRRQDPRIAARIHAALGDARSVVNVGAGTGAMSRSTER